MKTLITILSICIFISCTENNVELLTSETKNKEYNENYVSETEASNVANLFFSEEIGSLNKNTRSSFEAKNINSINTIYDEKDNLPLMYIINYNKGGFVIVSATKKYYPILAYSETESLNLDYIQQKTNSGFLFWKEYTKSAIKDSTYLDDATISSIHKLWLPYENRNGKETNTTRTTPSYDPVLDRLFYDRLSQLSAAHPDFSYGPLKSASSFLSPNEYESLVQKANLYGCSLNYAIIGTRRKPTKLVEPIIGTQWSQDTPYNDLCPHQYPAGCVAIAMAQIMKYHKVPTAYNWNNIPNKTATIDTQELIVDVGKAVDMDYGADGSSSNIDKAVKGFSSMGYNVIRKEHKSSDVIDELYKKRRPVYMRGNRKEFIGISWKGHAWVCEGIKSADLTVEYFVEYLIKINGEYIYSTAGGPTWATPVNSTGVGLESFYYNWGWGSEGGNGWYGFPSSPKGTYQYDRENLYVTPK